MFRIYDLSWHLAEVLLSHIPRTESVGFRAWDELVDGCSLWGS